MKVYNLPYEHHNLRTRKDFVSLADHEAALKAKDLEIKLLKSHYRQGYFDLMKAQLDDPIAAGEKVKEIDAEIQKALEVNHGKSKE